VSLFIHTSSVPVGCFVSEGEISNKKQQRIRFLRIFTFKPTYLFVDYGEVSSQQSSLKVQEDYFRLALTVAHPLSANTLNMAEEIVLNDRLFNLIRSIREYMKNDRQDPFIKRLTFPQEIQP